MNEITVAWLLANLFETLSPWYSNTPWSLIPKLRNYLVDIPYTYIFDFDSKEKRAKKCKWANQLIRSCRLNNLLIISYCRHIWLSSVLFPLWNRYWINRLFCWNNFAFQIIRPNIIPLFCLFGIPNLDGCYIKKFSLNLKTYLNLFSGQYMVMLKCAAALLW